MRSAIQRRISDFIYLNYSIASLWKGRKNKRKPEPKKHDWGHSGQKCRMKGKLIKNHPVFCQESVGNTQKNRACLAQPGLSTPNKPLRRKENSEKRSATKRKVKQLAYSVQECHMNGKLIKSHSVFCQECVGNTQNNRVCLAQPGLHLTSL